MNKEWYNIPSQTKINAYTQVAESTGMAPYAVEKDWWVVQVLSAIFEMEVGKHLIFKGGTSLSKAWRLIERFSEDIDLVFDRSYFGFDGELTRTQVKNLRKRAGAYIKGTLSSGLENKLKDSGLSDIRLNYLQQDASDADPVKIEIHYPNVIEYPGYVEPRVLLEISCSSLMEPAEKRFFSSLLDDQYLESAFAQEPIEIPSAIPERTFLEKLFLLHEEFRRPMDKIRVNRLSRHLYDIFQLLKSEYGLLAIDNHELYQAIVKHRYVFNRIGGVNYNQHQPQTINPIPIPEIIDVWEADYRTMQEEMIYGNSPDFQELIDTIKNFTVNVLNQLDWKMDIEFPKPK